MAEKNEVSGDLDGELLARREAEPEEVDAVALQRKGLGHVEGEERQRAEDGKKADELLGKFPLDVSEITTVALFGDPDRRIVQLKDGTLGFFSHGKETQSIYVEANRKFGGVLIEYDADTGEEKRRVFVRDLEEKPQLAYAKLKAMNDKLHPQPPDKIDVEDVTMVDYLKSIPDRHIVKLKDGTLAIEHTVRGSYILVYDKILVEYDSTSGEKGREITPDKLSGSTKQAYLALQKLKSA